MDSRRRFIGRVATGLAGTIAVPSTVLGAGSRVRVGVIGAGDRGHQLAREALACGNTQVLGFADVYPRRLEASQAIAPAARLHGDYRPLLEDPEIDAVVIATPPHLHAEQILASLDAGKHVYVEKTMAFTLDQAKLVRAAAARSSRIVIQVGHQWCSSGQYAGAERFLKAGGMGKITAIHAHMYRNSPRGKPPGLRPLYPDMTPETISWGAFQGQADASGFDANRYANWRSYWDYSGGSVFEHMSQQLAFWYKALDLQIPSAVSMLGGVHLWEDGREVPDTMSVAMEHAEQILFSWDSGFGNNQLGASEEVLGTDGTISRAQQVRYLPQKVNRPDGSESLSLERTRPNAHMYDFLDCIRNGGAPSCPAELGYRVSVACRMAVESYRQGRTVRWDPVREVIL
ncbi:MAG: Gfo/Idh/MocA family oxidoreductase [Bryobacterales bacterium]|nr:Gfo/Idh/MocA family oxidoreductase [Bryobacterales bacterium]